MSPRLSIIGNQVPKSAPRGDGADAYTNVRSGSPPSK